MLQGHGDDLYRFARPIRANFSSNVPGRVDLGALKAHLQAHLDLIGHYPEPEPYTLEAALAAKHAIDPAAVCATNGATEAIYLIANAFARSHSTILQPTFSEYADACRLYHHLIIPGARQNLFEPSEGALVRKNLPLHQADAQIKESAAADGFLPSEQFSASEVKTRSCGALIWLCNPNNPTGSVVPVDKLRAAIEDHPQTIFVIDQSYGFFTREPLLSAAEAVRYPNVIQLHSMTKRYAMPGLRLGYMTGSPTLLAHIRNFRMPWSVNALAIEAGLYLCAHPETAPIDLPALLAETRRLRERLNTLPGLTAEPTQTHFFLCRLAAHRASDLKQWLADRHGLLIRDASNFEGLDAGAFRIATQTPEENELLVEAVRQYLEEEAAR
ncbi:MAG: pyridoxal phosphate-dependent class II aminotransferase [Bacteroidales bacterium]|nr:pyridoxal phosphate-dependent class II aminotransferase [Bacteroidales bacterium]